MLNNASLYRSPQGYAAMMNAYRKQLLCWPVPYEERTVETRYGETHLLISGPESAPPLVLVHGLASNALVWYPNIAFLSKYFRTYALDNIGDAGMSAPTRPPLYGPAYGEWMVDVLDALEVEQANVMGMSLGGWITFKFAIHAPERARKLITLCPAGFVPLKFTFITKAVTAFLFPQDTTIDQLARTLCSPTKQLRPPDREQLDMVMRYHRSKLVPVIPLSNEELSRVTVPVLLMVGEDEGIYYPDWTVERAQQCLKTLHAAEIIPNAGHALNSDAADVLHDRVLNFLLAQ